MNVCSRQKLSSSPNATAVSSNDVAVLTMTVYHRLPYRLTAVARSSQHAALSSQSLGDLANCIPCVSNEIPEEICEGDELIGYDPNTIHKNPGAVVLIEDVLYGDNGDDRDYAECVSFADRFSPFNSSLLLVQQTPKATRGAITRPARSVDQVSDLA